MKFWDRIKSFFRKHSPEEPKSEKETKATEITKTK
jgi:hypothetical protein